MQLDTTNLAAMIDHTLLKPDAIRGQVARLCQEARHYNFASVCVNSTFVQLCVKLLEGSPVKVCTVIGFPLGATVPQAKAYESRQALENGATELDMVANIGALKDKDDALVLSDIEAVVQAAQAGKALVKVIIETCLLTEEEKIRACLLTQQAGADYVKTSTGFGVGGATAQDIALIRRTVGPKLGVKASGGVRTYADAKKLIEAGATRIGASASVRIMLEAGVA